MKKNEKIQNNEKKMKKFKITKKIQKFKIVKNMKK